MRIEYISCTIMTKTKYFKRLRERQHWVGVIHHYIEVTLTSRMAQSHPNNLKRLGKQLTIIPIDSMKSPCSAHTSAVVPHHYPEALTLFQLFFPDLDILIL